MATWKKIVVSGSSILQLNNDAGYLTAGTLGAKNAFSTASYNGTPIISDSITGSLNFASSSGQGLTISANAGTDTLTFGLSAIPNSSLLNSSVLIGGQTITLGAAATTTLTGMTSISSTSFTGSFTGSFAGDGSGLTNVTAVSASFASTASYVNTLNQNVIISGALDISLSPYSSNLQIAGNGFGQTYLSTAGAIVLNPGSGGVGMAGVNQYIQGGYFIGTANGSNLSGSFSGSFQGNGSDLTGVVSSSFASTAPYSGLTGVPSGLVSGSSQITYSGITGIPAGIVSASVLSSPAQGEALLTTNGVAGSTIDLGLQTTDSPSFAGVTAGNIRVGFTNDNTIDTTSGDLTIVPNVILNSNLIVFGTASFQSTQNLQVADRFVLLASGSSSPGDGGIVVQQGTQNVGELFGFDSGTTRWAVTSSFTADTGTFAPDAFMAAVTSLASVNPNTTGPAARYSATGNIFVSSGDESIWIYS